MHKEESVRQPLKLGALALLKAGENQPGWAARWPWLVGANLNKTATNTLVTAHTVGSVGAIDSSLTRTLLGCLALRSDGAVGSSTEAANAGFARKATASRAADAIGVIVGRWERQFSLARGAGTTGAAGALAATTHTGADEATDSLAALTSGKVLATLVLGSGKSLEFL